MSAEKELESLVKQAKDAYYNTGNFLKVSVRLKFPKAYLVLVNHDPSFWEKRKGVIVIDDPTYDQIEESLREINPRSPALKTGIQPKASGKDLRQKRVLKQKVDLPFYMGSLDKVKPEDVERWLSKNPGPYLVMDKEDGLSIGLVYKKGQVWAYTRGDGLVGQDITYLIPHLKVPKKLSKDLEVRGEIIMDRATFERKYSKDFENPRNMASGLVNRKNVHHAINDIEVVVYEVVSPRGQPSQQLGELAALGFTVVPHSVQAKLGANHLSKWLEQRKKLSKYDIDGLVVMQDRKTPPVQSGNPKHAVAFKDMSQVESAIGIVVGVEWNASKWGKLSPVVLVKDEQGKPLRLSGTNVSRVSAFNAKYIVDNRIGKGAQVEVRKRGEIIPYIENVISPAKQADLPSVKEFGEYTWTDSEVDLVLVSPETDDAVNIKQIAYFFKTIGVDDLGEGLIAKFCQHGLNSIERILNAEVEDFLELPGIKDTLARKLYQNIKKATASVYLPVLMDASGVFGKNMGSKRIEFVLTMFYPSIMTWDELKPETIIRKVLHVEGFKDVLAEQFAKNIGQCLGWIKRVGIPYHFKKEKRSGALNGVKVYLTGFRSKDLVQAIEDQGGEVLGSFSKKVTHLLVRDHLTINTKTETAQELGIPIMTEREFRQEFELKDNR